VRRLRRVVAIGFAGVLWASCLSGVSAAQPVSQFDIEAGRVLFENACSSCHGIGGTGTDMGPSVIGSGAAGADFMLTTGRMPLDNHLRQPVRKPPAFNPTEIHRISEYVASLGPGPEIPDVDLERADLVDGHRLYAENCAACHSSGGAGGAVGAGLEAPSLARSNPVQVVQAMRIGPGAMPVFGEQTLSDEEADSIALYLMHLRDSGDPGGLGMGRIGPIAEGAIAWIVGLGLLVLVCRWIGEKE